MSLASQLAAPHVAVPMVETNITSMSETGLIVLSVCAVLLAGVLLIPVMLAGRAPRRTGRLLRHRGPAPFRAGFTSVTPGA